MKCCAAAFAGLLLGVTPIAHAQTGCTDIARLNASGLGGFESIAGPVATAESSDEIYESRATLFGADACQIDKLHEPVHACRWVFDTEAQLMAAYRTNAATLESCLGGWERQDLLLSHPGEPGYRVIAGVGYLGADVYDDLTWAMLAEYVPDSQGKSWQLVVETTAY